MVHNNYSSALVVEDDVDWDVRLKSLLKDFALSHIALAQNPSAAEINFKHLPYITTPRSLHMETTGIFFGLDIAECTLHRQA